MSSSGRPEVEGLRRNYEAWQRLTYPTRDYPPGSPEGAVAGVDLALLDGDAAYVVAAFFDPTLPRGDFDAIRRSSLQGLEQVCAQLTGDGRIYFGALLDLVRTVNALIAKGEPPP